MARLYRNMHAALPPWPSVFLVITEDDACAALVAPVRHRPVQQHHDAVAEADQEEHVRSQPEPPGQDARQQQGDHQEGRCDRAQDERA
ncbi:hypothetical protein G6F59_017425 [Rhizopus arrhizus]|nr:hypothetical protein G6F59_017425 [Rhizopus arrhizus]